MRFIVDVDKWARGKQQEETYLLGDDGMMCCLGFAALQCGVPPENLLHNENPCNVTGKYKSELLSAGLITEGFDDSDFSDAAIDINDDSSIDDDERMRRLRALAKEHGHQFVFRKGGKK